MGRRQAWAPHPSQEQPSARLTKYSAHLREQDFNVAQWPFAWITAECLWNEADGEAALPSP